MGYINTDGIKLQEKSAGGGEPTPDGTYDFLVTEATARTSQTGKNYLNVCGQILGSEVKGNRVFGRLFFSSDKACEVSAKFLKSCNVSVNGEIDTLADLEALAARIMQRKFRSRIWTKPDDKYPSFVEYLKVVDAGDRMASNLSDTFTTTTAGSLSL